MSVKATEYIEISCVVYLKASVPKSRAGRMRDWCNNTRCLLAKGKIYVRFLILITR